MNSMIADTSQAEAFSTIKVGRASIPLAKLEDHLKRSGSMTDLLREVPELEEALAELLKDKAERAAYIKKVSGRIKTIIKSVEADAEVILHGSQATGRATEESDWDLLVVTGGEVNLKRENSFREALYPLGLELNEIFSVLLTSSDKWKARDQHSFFLQNVKSDGILL